MELKVRKLDPFAKLPSYGTSGAAGMDLYALEPEVLKPFSRRWIRTGVAVEIPAGFYAGFVWPRSGWAGKYGIDRMAGLIDNDYRSEIKVLLFNTSDEYVTICAGDRIAQMVVQPYLKLDIVEAEELSETERGERGFGSTGM